MLIALYGSLRRGERSYTHLGLDEKLKFVSTCVVPGQIYDLGDYPGLLLGEGEVIAELFELSDPAEIAMLDDFEQFDTEDIPASHFVRQRVRLKSPDTRAWVYVYNLICDHKYLADRNRIMSGDWAAFRAGRSEG